MCLGWRIERRVEDVQSLRFCRGGIDGAYDTELGGRRGEGLQGRFELWQQCPEGRTNGSHIGHSWWEDLVSEDALLVSTPRTVHTVPLHSEVGEVG